MTTEEEQETLGHHKDTLLREEVFGGILFRRESGLCLEVNSVGFRLLTMLDWEMSLSELAEELPKLMECDEGESLKVARNYLYFLRFRGAIRHGGTAARRAGPPLPERRAGEEPSCEPVLFPAKLVAPEVVHLSITDNCNLDCPSCYLHHACSPEASLDELSGLISRCVGAGVLQLSFGGGEPLFRKDVLIRLVRQASPHMRTAVTTNGTLVDGDTVKALKDAGLHQLQFSLNGLEVTHEAVTGYRDFHKRLEGLRTAVEAGLFVGTNTILSKTLLPKLGGFLDFLEGQGVKHVNLIRPKCTNQCRDWFDEQGLGPEGLKDLRAILTRAEYRHPGLALTHDCSLVQLYQAKDRRRLRAEGIHGCVAWKRMCYVAPTLDVYGCSHLMGEEAASVSKKHCGSSHVAKREAVGNLREQELLELWRKAAVPVNTREACGGCDIREICLPCPHVTEKELCGHE